MADPVLGLLLENLNSLIHTEFGLLRGVREEVEKLSNKLSTVRAVIEDAETREHTDKAIAGWLRRLKDTAYDAEDVLDEWLTKLRLSELESTQVTHSIASWFHFNQPVFRHKIAKKIKNLHAGFDSIAREISDFDLKTRVAERGALLDPNRETSSLLVEPEQVYGRDDDQKKIVDLLLSDACSHYDVNVLPVVGVGGLGKTTLAQLVYNDDRVSKHFEVRMWVCVADDFDVKRLTTSIIACLSGKDCDLKDLDPLQNHLKELLSGRRFLLVLDDVWNDDCETWGKLKQSLTCGAKGSSILVTTRLETVASMMGTFQLYRLPLLSDGECWSLFKVRACGIDGNDLSADLVKIGKQIVQKCRGIPLAAKVLGALLRFKRNVSEWEFVRESEIWELPEEKGGIILSALRLSYNHLPLELKQCFSYCSLYPKDYELVKTELIQLWMANGYVRCIGRMELEDMGNYIFNELLRGSFFQEPQKDDFGNVVKCKMHDLMHDLACSLTKTEICAIEVGKIDIAPAKTVRHLSNIGKWSQESSLSKLLYQSNKSLRTYLDAMVGNFYYINKPPQVIFKLKYIRVLKLSNTGIQQVPNSIGGMKCLRYLNLSCNYNLGFLPDSICSLINLQTLNLRGCSRLKALPKDMRKMRSLRHLDVGELSKMPIKMGEMTGLRTLNRFVVGEKKGGQIDELNGLKYLSGELELRRLELVKNSTEAKEADLASKPNLSSLTFCWGTYWGTRGTCLQEEEEKKKSERVLECLKPHVNLNQILSIDSYPGVRFPNWMSLLRNLRKIGLWRCYNCETLPPLGQLPLLQVLVIWGMASLKCIGVEFYGEIGGHHLKVFPSLEALILFDCPKLEKWEFPSSLLNDDASFPTLRRLSLLHCPKLETPSILTLTSTSCLRKLNSLSIGGVSFTSIHNHTVETLELQNKDSILSGEFDNLTALKSLKVTFCDKLKSIPDEIGNLKALESLVISCCSDLISLPAEGLQKLTSLNLNSLQIDGCISLKTLPAMGRMIQQGMTMKSSCCSLVLLNIQFCKSLTSVSEGLRYLSSLQTLDIDGGDELELKREDFQHLTCLRHLTLKFLPKLKSLPDVQNLSSLETLYISGCDELELKREDFHYLICLRDLNLWSLPKLKSVPDVHTLTALQSLKFGYDQDLRMLPEGLQHLTSLQSLQVHVCHPDLHKRLERDQGVDWPNISHIPSVRI